jgi:hypothetical protein
MADLTEIGRNPENFNSHEAVPKGIKLFKFVDMFQQMCMQPIPLKLNNLVKNN